MLLYKSMYTGIEVIHSLFFLFIKDIQVYSDKDIFDWLGMEMKRFKNGEDYTDNYHHFLYITNDDSWTHIIDGMDVTLMSKEDIRERIDALGKRFEVYFCTFGDTDYSYELKYYKDGKLVRWYNYHDAEGTGISPEELIDIGTPFLRELNHNFREPNDLMLSIAVDLGIDLNHKDKDIRIYDTFEESYEYKMEIEPNPKWKKAYLKIKFGKEE